MILMKVAEGSECDPEGAVAGDGLSSLRCRSASLNIVATSRSCPEQQVATCTVGTRATAVVHMLTLREA